MKRNLAGLVLLCFCVAHPAFAQRPMPPPEKSRGEKGDKEKISFLVTKAQFVYVMSQREADFGQRPDMEDLRVIADTESALRKWGRYRVVLNQQDADLIISVYREGTRLPGGVAGPRGPSGGGIPGAEARSPGDNLAVYQARTGTTSSPLWRRSQKDGLSRPRMSLVKALEDEVEAAGKTP